MPALFLTQQIVQWGDLLFTSMELLNLAAAYSGKKPHSGKKAQEKPLLFLEQATHSPLQSERSYRSSGSALTLKRSGSTVSSQFTYRITQITFSLPKKKRKKKIKIKLGCYNSKLKF